MQDAILRNQWNMTSYQHMIGLGELVYLREFNEMLADWHISDPCPYMVIEISDYGTDETHQHSSNPRAMARIIGGSSGLDFRIPLAYLAPFAKDQSMTNVKKK